MKSCSVVAKLAVFGALTLFSTGAFAMGPSDTGDHHPGHHECGCMQKPDGHEAMMHHNRFPWILKEKLGLSGKQAGEISDIMKEESQNAKPLFEAIKKERTALMEAARSGNQAAIKAQAGKLADAIAAMAVHHAQVHKRIAAVMTKEQAEKFDKMAAEFAEHGGMHGKASCGKGHEKEQMHKHMEHHQD
ncbi:MAG TPA: Spy/CpxP family protein refolding chaperone [Desulfuromonadaceae bacterium]